MDSDQHTLNKTTGAASVLRGSRTRVTSIQGRGEAGSVLLLHDTSDATTAASGNLKATYRFETALVPSPLDLKKSYSACPSIKSKSSSSISQ